MYPYLGNIIASVIVAHVPDLGQFVIEFRLDAGEEFRVVVEHLFDFLGGHQVSSVARQLLEVELGVCLASHLFDIEVA